jgi:pimeloyl-ACP methyl ester carboxylesterase
VLIHGFSSTLDANWSNPGIIDKLSKDFRVIALDCRGHGKSDKPHDAASYGVNMIEDVTRLLDHLAIRKAHIVGYSMGGAITGKFIAMHPDRVISAVFGGSAPRMGWSAQNERDSEELAASLESGQGMRPLILRLAPPNEPKPSDEAIAQQSRAALGRNDALALAAVQRGNKAQAVTVAEIKALRMPLLAVIGGADPIKAGVEAFKQLKPELTVVVIDGATHSGARGAPARPEFVSAVRDFLVAHRSTSDL